MLRALTTAATGMIAQQNYLDVIANNVANVNTTAFKQSRIEFQDLLSQATRTPGALMNQGTYQPVGIEIGLGVKTAATTRVFTQGVAISTGRQLDIEIEGEGFLQVMKEDGSLAYTRDGCLQVDSLCQLCTNDGLLIQPSVSIPRDATEITITQDGNISVTLRGRHNSQLWFASACKIPEPFRAFVNRAQPVQRNTGVRKPCSGYSGAEWSWFNPTVYAGRF